MNTNIESEQLIVGIDLGGTKIRAAVATSEGKIIAQEYCATLAEEGPEAVIHRILAAIERVISLAGAKRSRLAGIGIAAAGLAVSKSGTIAFSPNLPGWCDVPLKEIVEKEIGVSTFLTNDANAAALGEHCYGAGRGVNDMIYITVGTGIGGGIIINSKLYTGACGVAGEIGHMTIDVNGPQCSCGNIGCLEAMASGTAIARETVKRLREGAMSSISELAKGELENITAQMVSVAAQKGDPLALEVIARAGTYLGVGMANLVNLFNPELIIVGGGVAQMGNMLFDPALKAMRKRAFELPAKTVSVVPVQLGENAGVLGMVTFIFQESSVA